MNLSPEQIAAIKQAAEQLGIDPADLAEVINYETGGTFSPSIYGGRGNNYMGLIQFGPEERRKYGASPDQSFSDQMMAVQKFLVDRGVKPGMGLMDIYSTVNAGSPGMYSASDRPGATVRSHVQDMMKSREYAMLQSMLANPNRTPATPASPGMMTPGSMVASALPAGGVVSPQPPAVAAAEPKGLLGLGGEDTGIINKALHLLGREPLTSPANPSEPVGLLKFLTSLLA